MVYTTDAIAHIASLGRKLCVGYSKKNLKQTERQRQQVGFPNR